MNANLRLCESMTDTDLVRYVLQCDCTELEHLLARRLEEILATFRAPANE